MFDSVTDRRGCSLHLHNTWKDAVYNGYACVNDRLFMNRIMFEKINYTMPVNGNDGLGV